MGLFDDFIDIANEFKGVSNDIKKEFTGLKSDVVSSVSDIRTGVAETTLDVKKKVRNTVNIDGMVRTGKKAVGITPAPAKHPQNRQVPPDSNR